MRVEAVRGRVVRPLVHQIQARVELEDPARRAAGLRSHSRHQEAAAGEGIEIVDDAGAGGARRLDQLRIIGLGHVEEEDVVLAPQDAQQSAGRQDVAIRREVAVMGLVADVSRPDGLGRNRAHGHARECRGVQILQRGPVVRQDRRAGVSLRFVHRPALRRLEVESEAQAEADFTRFVRCGTAERDAVPAGGEVETLAAGAARCSARGDCPTPALEERADDRLVVGDRLARRPAVLGCERLDRLGHLRRR